jgi:hypothetical protein
MYFCTMENLMIDGITAEVERTILRELEKFGVLVTCETCGECPLPGAFSPHCITTVRGNGICGKGKIELGSLRRAQDKLLGLLG